MTAAIYRLLFERAGTSLEATFPASDLSGFADAEIERFKRQGLIRQLPLDCVPCRSPHCTEDCEVRPLPAPESGPGMYRLPCYQGRVTDRIVSEREIASFQYDAGRLFKDFCKSNQAELAFDHARHSRERIVPMGRLSWANGALLCLGVGRSPTESELAGSLAFGARPVLVLIPPGQATGEIHQPAPLASLGVFVFDMERVVNWGVLELDRIAVSTAISQAAQQSSAEQPTENLVLRMSGCEAYYLGHRLELTVLEFGCLYALATEPGRIIGRDAMSDLAYGVYNQKRVDGKHTDADPGQLNKLKTQVLAAFKKLAAQGLVPRDRLENIIVSEKRKGYRLNETSVRIIS